MNESAPIIRRATPADLPALVALLADDVLGSGREDLADLAPYERAFATIDSDPQQVLAVLERGGEIVGTLQLTFIAGLSLQGATRALIESVRISSRERGRGLGTQLIEWAIDESRRRGARLVQLTTNASRTEAHRFYERIGFVASHVGFKMTIPEPKDEAAAIELPAGVTCYPELGVCTFEGESTPSGAATAPDIPALSGLGSLHRTT